MRLIDADALKHNLFDYSPPEMVWDRGDIEHKIDEVPTITAVPLEPLAQWLGRNYEPPYGNRKPSWPIDEHEQAGIWREYLEQFGNE